MKKYIKLLAALMAVAVFACILPPAGAQTGEIRIMINNQILSTDNPPVIVEGRTLVPLRAIGEAMGCEVTWESSARTANLRNDTTIVSMQVGNRLVTTLSRAGDGARKVFEIDVPPMLINDRTYIPARAFA